MEYSDKYALPPQLPIWQLTGYCIPQCTDVASSHWFIQIITVHRLLFQLFSHTDIGLEIEALDKNNDNKIINLLLFNSLWRLNCYLTLDRDFFFGLTFYLFAFQGIPKDGIHVFASQLHTHMTGKRTYTKHYRKGTELPELNRDNHYSPHYQEIRKLHRQVTVLPVSYTLVII